MTMNIKQKSAVGRRIGQAGVSLIELMIALLIAGLISLGLVQIFGASSATSQMTEGLSRVQENGRFASQFLQRQLRMVGFMGCGSDAGRTVQHSFVNHLTRFDGTVPGGNKYRFQRPIEAYTAGVGTAPAELAGEAIVDGTDVLILRVLSEESTTVVSVTKSANDLTLLIGTPGAAFLPEPNKKVLFGLQNCRSADIFAATLAEPRRDRRLPWAEPRLPMSTLIPRSTPVARHRVRGISGFPTPLSMPSLWSGPQA